MPKVATPNHDFPNSSILTEHDIVKKDGAGKKYSSGRNRPPDDVIIDTSKANNPQYAGMIDTMVSMGWKKSTDSSGKLHLAPPETITTAPKGKYSNFVYRPQLNQETSSMRITKRPSARLNANNVDPVSHVQDDRRLTSSVNNNIQQNQKLFNGNMRNDYQTASPKLDSPLVAENVKRGTAAMDRVIADQTDVIDAMQRPDLGSISFYWGDKKTGVKHIIDRRKDTMVMLLPEKWLML